MITSIAIWSILIAINNLVVMHCAHRKGVKDTEKRWSDAVTKKRLLDADDLANRERATA